jgi:hypothetical protein
LIGTLFGARVLLDPIDEFSSQMFSGLLLRLFRALLVRSPDSKTIIAPREYIAIVVLIMDLGALLSI